MTKQSSIARLMVSFFLMTSYVVKGSGGTPDVRAPSNDLIAAWQYTLTARVRLLLFWISRPGVGGGRIRWSERADGSQAVELLIGSDPMRAPMRINRWGYIIEHVAGSSSELVGVMTESGEQSIEQAKTGVTRFNSMHSFKGIRGSLAEGLAESTTMHLLLADDFTFRDVDLLLRQLPQKGTATRQIRVPNGTEPGFLFALKGLLHHSVENHLRMGDANTGRQTCRRFVYAGSLFELTLRKSRLLPQATVNGRSYHAVLESEFETRNTTTREASSFSITYGSQPPITEVPIRIVYRPRWWFEAELLLVSEPEAAEAAGRETTWNHGSK